MPVPLSALSSVLDRTLFTKKGPIVKPPLPLLTGSNLMVLSPNQVQIPTLTFDLSFINKTVTISGTPNERNDGTFTIAAIVNPTTLLLSDASLDASDPVSTLNLILTLANNIKAQFNAHVVNGGGSVPYVHGTQDFANIINVQDAVDLDTANILLNQLLTHFLNHIALVGPTPSVHQIADDDDLIFLPQSTNLASAFYLVNALKNAYEFHRDSPVFHYERDIVDRVTAPLAIVVFQSGLNIGPFDWVISDPRIGQVADFPGDVEVIVNSLEVSVDAVFGLLGAVVLTNKPGPLDVVTIDYDYLSNPPTQFQRLNSPEFNLNEIGNTNLTGLPNHQYRARATLLNPLNPTPTIVSPVQPLTTGWKYKMFERGYTACLNDPNTLLLNVPTNRVFYPVLDDQVFEVVIRYDPTSLPDQATDPWTLEGQGTMSLAPGGSGLTIIDNNGSVTLGIEPPFYTHPIDLTFDSTVSAAFRVSISSTTPDGVFTGVAFGIADGAKVAIVGLLLTNANNLSSAIVMANDLVAAFDTHLTQVGVHMPNDIFDAITVVNASDLGSLIILVNNIKTLFNQHLALGPNDIHLALDVVDPLTAPDAVDLASALVLVNEIWTNFNTHLTASGVHYNNDTFNSVGLVEQIGFLTNAGYPEFASSWNSNAVNWSIDATYRIFRDPAGDVSLYTSGAVVPTASVPHNQLPAASDVDIKLDPMAQVFFGAVWRQAKSKSKWAFIRVDVTPVDEDQIGMNKSVNYEPTVLPELDPTAPWITIGESGFERLVTSSLVLDSTASAPPADVEELGMTTGAYRGFLRLEPILTRGSTSNISFTANVGFYTFSLDNKAAGVFLDDDTFSTWFVFLQDTPSAATVTGTIQEPFSIATNDIAVIAVDSAEPITVTFVAPATSVAQVESVINAAFGFPLASDDGNGHIILATQTVGATSKLVLLGGAVLQKLGLASGTYFGKDSNPEPKVSWFGETFPNQDVPQWSVFGSQTPTLLGRTLRITDASTTDFLVYTVNNTLYSGPVLNPTTDWKLDFRLIVQSFTAGSAVLSGHSLFFAGVLVNIDEGIAGKNVELEYAVDQFGGTYINVVSYNPITGFLDQQAYFPFAWNDGKVHSIDLFTNKTANLCLVLADNVALGNFPYSSLNQGVSGPAITFGSGGTATANADLSTAQSVVDWESVCVFRDLKIADPTAASRRFVGIYGGGDPSLLASYYIAQVDWTLPHTYQVVRDPSGNVSVFMDGGNVPIISINYDAIKLPAVRKSFLQPITGNRECVAFGSFEPEEISRTIWGPVQYSIGKLTLTDNIIPAHQVINQANVVVSPEHLTTQLPHQHQGFTVYSGGTPTTDFMNDPNLPAFTNLGEGTPPVPMTQNLESRGGLVRTATLQESVNPLQFVNQAAFLSDLEDDTTNQTLLVTPVDLPTSLAVLNLLLPAFNQHLVQYRVHLSNDPNDAVALLPAVDLPSGIVLANQLLENYNKHLTATVDDSGAFAHVSTAILTPAVEGSAANPSFVTAPVAIDLPTLITLTTALNVAYNRHLTQFYPTNFFSPGVPPEPVSAHGNSIFINLSPPAEVIYEGAEFFTITNGTPGLLSPYLETSVVGILTDVGSGHQTIINLV